jgi:hypothetical protein
LDATYLEARIDGQMLTRGWWWPLGSTQINCESEDEVGAAGDAGWQERCTPGAGTFRRDSVPVLVSVGGVEVDVFGFLVGAAMLVEANEDSVATRPEM